ncbi:MAG TPA: TadE family protein [Terracidiphilus sp.]|nr:TadE family protein [Terracidiphilus sp.]
MTHDSSQYGRFNRTRTLLKRVYSAVRRAEEGSTLVEMALTSTVLFAMLFGIIEMSMAFYTYNFVAEAAREGTRYAIIRGEYSCLPNKSFPNCNLGPTNGGSSAVQTYIQGLGFPFASGITASAAWYSPSVDSSGVTTWPTSCTTATDAFGNPCNKVGNAVQVQVSYAFPLAIPFSTQGTLTVSSTSQMVISY